MRRKQNLHVEQNNIKGMKGCSVERVRSFAGRQRNKPIEKMFYGCCIICFVARSCFGLAPQCDDSVSELKGTLGEPFLFERVALELKYDSLTLQQANKNTRTKLIIYSQTSDVSNKSYNEGYRYNQDKAAFEILELQRKDQGMYEIMVNYGSKDTFCIYDLKVYEKITNVSIKVTHNLQNDSCVVTMDCVLQSGDNVTFSWTEDQKDLHQSSRSLIVHIANDNSSSNYSCRAENPVSSGSSEVCLMNLCSVTSAESVIHFDLKFLLIGLLGLILIVIVGILIRKRLKQKIGNLPIRCSPQQMNLSPNIPSETVEAEPISTVYLNVQKKVSSTPRENDVPSQPVKQVPITFYDRVQRKKSEENDKTVYELAGPCTVDRREDFAAKS
ncbi:signaling lymphocytic activation molecule-like [Mantella aurantiaca]